MKKITLIIILSLLPILLFAYTDSFRYLIFDTEYNNLIEAIKNNDSSDTVEKRYNEYLSKNPNAIDLTRVEYQLVRYYVDNDDKELAKAHLEKCSTYSSKIDEESFKAEIARLEEISARYYLNEKMSDGLESSNRSKAIYKSYPDEVSSILFEANRYLYTPGIAGGSTKKAIQAFETLLPYEDKLTKLDLFSLYSGLGLSYEKKDKSVSLYYLEKAESLFSGDKQVIKALRKLRK